MLASTASYARSSSAMGLTTRHEGAMEFRVLACACTLSPHICRPARPRLAPRASLPRVLGKMGRRRPRSSPMVRPAPWLAARLRETPTGVSLSLPRLQLRFGPDGSRITRRPPSADPRLVLRRSAIVGLDYYRPAPKNAGGNGIYPELRCHLPHLGLSSVRRPASSGKVHMVVISSTPCRCLLS